MSKFAMIVALMLVTGYDAYCLYTFPTTDVQFHYAAYVSGAVAALLVYLEFFHVIYDGITGAIEARREKKAVKQWNQSRKIDGTVVSPTTEVTPSTTTDPIR